VEVARRRARRPVVAVLAALAPAAGASTSAAMTLNQSAGRAAAADGR
jgi:hypothetical protein